MCIKIFHICVKLYPSKALMAQCFAEHLPPACAGDSGDAAMAAAFEEVVGPAAERFQPDIILVR